MAGKQRKTSNPSARWIEVLAVAALCAAFALLASRQIVSTSATFDEVAHLPAGYSYLVWGDYRMNPEHPPLIKKLAALPLLAGNVWPRRTDIATKPDPNSPSRDWLNRCWSVAMIDPNMAQWNFGHHMLYGVRDEALQRLELGSSDPQELPPSAKLDRGDFLNDADALLMRGRMVILALGVALALLIYAWTRELFGFAGGLLALTLYCFDPNFLAHSGLVTTDVGISLFMFGSVYFLWRASRRLHALDAALTAVFVACAFVAKFSAVVLVPVFVAIGLVRIFSHGPWPLGARRMLATRWRKAGAFAALLGVCAVVTFAGIWAAYGFRYAAMTDADTAEAKLRQYFAPDSAPPSKPGTLPIERIVDRTTALAALYKSRPESMPAEDAVQKAMATTAPGLAGRLVLFASEHHLLPEAYLYGFAYAGVTSLARASFLMGAFSNYGFRAYFLWAFLFKTPLPTLLALAAAAVVALRRRMPWASQLAFLAIPAGIYALISLGMGLNIGHRHLLPIYPFLFVFCGVLTTVWREWKPRTRTLTAAAALAAVAISSSVVFAPPWKPAIVFPHYLAYFNELAGGPRNGARMLVDSNLDWGQDLPGLKKWTDAHLPADQPAINLCYFGMADPRYYGIPHAAMPGGYLFEKQGQYILTPDGAVGVTGAVSPGYLAISATDLSGANFSPQGRELWGKILKHATLVDTIGYSIFIYKVEGMPTE